ncbi:MAG: hypothetical protein JW755_07705, partial [Candidatus Aminicenantes bacterium]|nr:hypothetical protein [Candidatus Aminicenantes bacterium]
LYPFPIFQLASLFPGLQFNPGTHLRDDPLGAKNASKASLYLKIITYFFYYQHYMSAKAEIEKLKLENADFYLLSVML